MELMEEHEVRGIPGMVVPGLGLCEPGAYAVVRAEDDDVRVLGRWNQ
jgi:hypothetical protein